MKLRNMIRTAAISLALALWPGPSASAQEHKHESQQDAPTIRLSTELVSLSVTVTDQKGRAVTGLKREDFKVYENGLEQPLSFFSAEEAPVCWGLVLDRSGSKTRSSVCALAAKRRSGTRSALRWIISNKPDIARKCWWLSLTGKTTAAAPHFGIWSRALKKRMC